jgi:hypothetical protein
VIACVAVCLLAVYGLSVGWRHRAGRQTDLPALPAVPDDLGPDLVPPVTGMYVSTTTAGSWQDRIVAHGLGRRAAGAIRLSDEGVCIERDGEADIFIPTADLVAVTTAPGIAGKVIGQSDGILVVRWSLGDTLLDSGFRSDDSDAQDDFLDAAVALVPAHPRAGTTAVDQTPAPAPDGGTDPTNGVTR